MLAHPCSCQNQRLSQCLLQWPVCVDVKKDKYISYFREKGFWECVLVLLLGKAGIHRDIAAILGPQTRAGNWLASRHHERKIRHVFYFKTQKSRIVFCGCNFQYPEHAQVVWAFFFQPGDKYIFLDWGERLWHPQSAIAHLAVVHASLGTNRPCPHQKSKRK